MQLTNINIIKNLCKKLDIRPSKKLGQNFLINKNILNKIVKAGELSEKDNILEIGPGFGVLTQELLKYTDNLVVVEKDKKLYSRLKIQLTKYKNKKIEIINDDILKIFNFQDTISKKNPNFKFQTQDYKIISNLPYQITSPVLWKFLHEEKNKPELMVLMVQKEVAERIVASPVARERRDKPGKMSILSVLCQFYAECEIVAQVSRSNFWPEPDVDSAVIKLKIKNNYDNINYKTFFKIVKIGFSAKRKMLKNNLSAGLKISALEAEKILIQAGLDRKVRAQELSIEDWIKLIYKLKIQSSKFKKISNTKF